MVVLWERERFADGVLATAPPTPTPDLCATPLPPSPTITASINFSSRSRRSRTSLSVDGTPSMLSVIVPDGGSSPSYRQRCLARAQFPHGRVNLSHLTFLLRHVRHGLGKAGAGAEEVISPLASSDAMSRSQVCGMRKIEVMIVNIYRDRPRTLTEQMSGFGSATTRV